MGVLECWATNSVGEAKEPCTFQLVAAGKNGTFGRGKSIFWLCIQSTDRALISRSPILLIVKEVAVNWICIYFTLLSTAVGWIRNIDRTNFCL